MKWNMPNDTLNKREAMQICGMPIGPDGEDATYARVGSNYGFDNSIVTAITLTDDGLGAGGFYTRVTVWAGEKLLAEFALHNLEGVMYV